MELNLKGKTVIVTGGASGIGAGISEVFAEEGANVVVNYRSKEQKALKFVKELNEKNSTKCTALYADISEAEDIEKLMEMAVKIYGKIDVLVNNAGIWPTVSIRDMRDEEWEEVIRINLTGPFLFSKRFVNYLINNKRKGKIINILSKSAYSVQTPGHAHYAASKGGLHTFTLALAREVSQYGINVVGVIPGMVRTPMNTKQLAVSEEKYLKRIPVGRISNPREVAYTVAFLASEKADYITGAAYDVTGGMLI